MRINIGAVIVSVFAIAWAVAGASSLGRRWRATLSIAAVLVSGAIIFVSGTIAPAHPVQFNAAAYMIAVAFELVLIFAAVVYLKSTGRKDLLLPVISIIVGLHFFGMVWALGSGEYWWIASAICLLPIATMSMLPGKLWMPVVGLGCAVILWLSVLWAVIY
jgi:hypothetical protein